MEYIIFKSGSTTCTVSPEIITIVPNSRIFGIGTHFIVDKSKQDIELKDQIIIRSKRITLLKQNYSFSDVYRLGKIRTDTRDSGTDISPYEGKFQFEEDHRFDYDLFFYLRSGKQIKVANITHSFETDVFTPFSLEGWSESSLSDKCKTILNSPVDGIVLLETMLQEMIGLPEEY